MPSSPLTADTLTTLLERLALPLVKTPANTADGQVEFLIGRIKLLTAALASAESNDAERLTARILLSDLAQVAAQFRVRTGVIGTSLETALDELHGALEQLPGRT